MGLRDIGHTLPPGFRFYPSDEELVCHYLYNRITNQQLLINATLVDIDLHTCEPWQLPDVAKLNSNEWYFFSFRDRKYATGFRTNRATTSGYWKATGKDRAVLDPQTLAVVGMRKTLVFYKNRAPNGTKTGWIMHEFRLENPNLPPKEDWVLCRVFHKSRGEESNKFVPQTLYNCTSAPPTSPNLAASPTVEHATCLPSTCANIANSISQFSHQHQHQGQNPSTSIGLSAVDPTAYFLPSHDHINGPHSSTSDDGDHDQTKCHEGDYGFLFDMSFDYWNGSSMPSNLDRMYEI
ncbi:NAC domain-containing protein 21/22 isoform X1 [Sesamum indicum]|uniref:NAC domain-containing protein 21/22 isoform X1 n=1 Tax=Sesamum indicum TaxID=4182 RepID=A0A6I9TJ36_SESIN|nr:NAC domain-containing protein 21/22 isoform X1 [Sesamum indicum]